MTFSPHTYINRVQSLGADEAYIEVLRRNIAPLAQARLPVLLTLGHLSFATNVPYPTLLGISKRTIDPYRIFSIRKRSGGKRYISVPESGLLNVQRWIHDRILCSPFAERLLSNNSTAYRPGSSHIDNAKRHLGAPWVLKLDITQFFESISERQVYHVFRALGYRAQVAFLLARLCTRTLPQEVDWRLKKKTKRWMPGRSYKFLQAAVVGHLPQGAPTSPMLANLVCYALDLELQKIADRCGLTYTRYADDMTFSGDEINRETSGKLIKDVCTVLSRNGFGMNHQKTHIAKNGSRKIVTGISISEDVLRLPRAYKDSIRQELHYIGKFGLTAHCARLKIRNKLTYLLRLAGRIKYSSFIEPALGKAYMDKLLTLVPNISEIESMCATKRGD
jgi:RNA-directed DNA polymerase